MHAIEETTNFIDKGVYERYAYFSNALLQVSF